MCVCGLCVCVSVCVGGGRKLGWKRKICHSLVFIKRVEAVQLCLVVAEEKKFDDKENVLQQRNVLQQQNLWQLTDLLLSPIQTPFLLLACKAPISFWKEMTKVGK